MDQGKKSGRIPEDEAASQDEIVEAFEALSDNEQRRLYKYADSFALMYSYKLVGVFTGDDLFNEAFIRTFDGRRRWRKDSVDFFGHLYGVISSIANEWSNKKLEGKLHKVHQDKEGKNPIDNLASSGQKFEETLAAKEEIGRIEKYFEGDSQAQEVIDGWGSGWGGSEIKEVLGFNQTQYETIVKRIRRGVEKLKKEEDIHG